ncbi:hypothetical protein QTP86_030328 [Hemibagrus guttatus]|nr:hypothetical protein QTP86_030328 [Hemibagrus guttatus]
MSMVTGSLCLSQASSGIKAGYTLDRVPTHCRAHTHAHSITHYGQFRDANQPTMHVFGPGEETGALRGNPRGTGRTCKASEYFVLKVDVLEAGKMGKRKDLSEFDKGQILMARRLDE